MDILVLTQQGGILKPFGIILGIIMNYIYLFLSMLGIENIAIAIILFTFIINVLMIPLTIKQQKFQKMSSIMQPELKKIQKKYDGRKDERSMRMQQAETQALYDKYGASPTGGCLPLLIQMPILFALYRIIYNIPAYVPQVKALYMNIADPIFNAAGSADKMAQFISDNSLRVMNFDGTNIDKIIDALYTVPSTAWDALSKVFEGAPDVVSAIDMYSDKIVSINTFIGGMNLSNAPVHLGQGIPGLFPGILIPVLAGLSQWINIKINQRNSAPIDTDSQMGSTMNTMNTMMPLMSVFFCISLPTGIGLYWIASAVFRTLCTLFIDFAFLNKSVESIIEENKEVAAKKAEKRQEREKQIEQYSTMRTKSISKLANTSVEGKGENAKSVREEKNVSSSNNRGSAKKGSVSGYANMLKKDK